MRITPSQLSIVQLFSTKNEQFFIPAYQRRYAWGDRQVIELFEDINLLDKSDAHFLGTILLLTESHKADINTLELVDGQQRIISLSLLFKAIKDRFIELKKEEIAKEIENYVFCQGLNRTKQNKIVLGDLDEPDYHRVLEMENPNEIKNKNLLNAYDKFKEKLKNYSFEKLNEFYFKLINNTIVVRLDTEKAKDAYKLFETINNRGLRLSPTDIIKNFLLGHASMIDENTLNKVRQNWKDLIVNLDDIETDDFFRQFISGIFSRKVTFKKLIFEFKSYYLSKVKEAEILPDYKSLPQFQEYVGDEENNDEDESEKIVTYKKIPEKDKSSIIDFSNFLKELSLIYSKIIKRTFDNQKINRHLYNLERIESKPAYIFLLYLFFVHKDVEDNKKIEILKLIEIFMLRRHICEERTAILDDIFSKLKVKDENIVSQVKEELSKYLPDDKKFEENFAKHNFKGKKNRAKYVLEQFEYNLIVDQREYIINSGNDVHLEHIIPQTIETKRAKKEYGDWVTYIGKDAVSKYKEYIDRIGNYTLLGQSLNIRAKNNPFLAKKKEYKKSNIKLTQQIAEKFSSFKFKEVNKRSKNFASTALKIWKFN